MKIDPRAQSSQQTAPVAAEPVRQAVKPADQTPDAVTLSSQLRLADEAVRAAAVTGDVRPRAVARARALMDAGQLGNDLERLADRIIDHLIDTRADRS